MILRAAAIGYVSVVVVCTFLMPRLVAEDPPAAGEGDSPPAETGAADAETGAAEPEFKTPAAQQAFQKGRTSFAGGDYRDAAKSFRSAQSGAKSKADKDAVQKWVDASSSATSLPLIDAYVKRGKLNVAYDQLASVHRKVAGTPAAALFLDRLRDVETKLFFVLENFDVEKRSFSPEYGKTYVADAKFVYRGERSLRWVNSKDGKPGMLKLTPVPRDWRAFDSVELSVYWTVPAAVEAVIVTEAKLKNNPAAPVPRSDVVPVFLAKLPAPARAAEWQQVSLKLSDFKVQGGASLESVTEFRLQIPGGKAFDFLVDEVRLRRKDAGDESAAKPAAGGGKAKS